jgi:transposase InsO family protein
MRDHKLLLPQRSLRRNDTRAHDGRVAVDASDIRWCSDGFEIACWNKERVRVAFGDLTDAKTVLAQLPAWFEHYNSLGNPPLFRGDRK